MFAARTHAQGWTAGDASYTGATVTPAGGAALVSQDTRSAAAGGPPGCSLSIAGVTGAITCTGPAAQSVVVAETVTEIGNGPQAAQATSVTTTTYKVYDGSSGSVALTSPAMSAGVTLGPMVGGQVGVGVTYAAAPSPVTITLGGGAIKDSSTGNWDILIGQQCLPSLAGVPSGCKLSNYHWGVSGTTFQKWDPSTTPPTYNDGHGPLNGPNTQSNPTVPPPSWYWNEAVATETITCTATVTPSAGQGAAFSVSATQKVSVMVPTWTATIVGGYMQIGQFGIGGNFDNYDLEAEPTPNMLTGTPKYSSGINWDATVNTPTSPAFGTGNVELIQIIKPKDGYATKAGTVNDPNYGLMGSDGAAPYGPAQSEPTYSSGDSPGIELLDSYISAFYQSSFVDYLMYQPPGGKNAPSMYVPLAMASWSANGNASQPANGWATYASPQGQTLPQYAGSVSPMSFTGWNQFPTWSRVITPVQF